MTISCIGHAVALGCALIAISATPMEVPPVDSLPVQFISDKDFTQLTQGVKNAPKLKIEMPKPLADKVDAPKAVDQLAPKAADKPEIKTDSAKAKPPPKPEPKPDPKQAQKAEKPKPPEYKPDQIADLLKKDAAKKPAKPDDQSKPQKADAPKFDANQVAQLLDKRDPRRQLASNATLNDVADLGAASGAQSAQMSQSEIDALRARISSCWSPPPGIDANSKVYVVLRVLFKPDGSLVQEPVLVEATASSLGPALADSAKRALLLCQPFTMLRPDHYSQWKDLELKFDPHELLGG
ncbi:MAG TPA: protein TolA [Xanthobacteraceae bacterium]|nr:protein TolA [Xanthobacteraceae bacterium]